MGRPDQTDAPDDAGRETSPAVGDPAGGLDHHPAAFAPGVARGRRVSRWILISAVLVGVSLLTALLAFGLGRDPTVINSPLVGHTAPGFALRTLDGSRTVRLADLRGRVVVVNFWASWCAACREEHPSLMAAWERYRDQGVVLIGVDYQDSKKAALQFMQEMGGDWPTVEDPGGRTALDYGVYGVPETFFIGLDGVIRHKTIGPSSYELLTDEIQRLMPHEG